MPTPWQIVCLRARLRSLYLEISRVAEKDHPYPDPDTVYDALKEVIKSRTALFEEAVENYPLGGFESERKLQGTFDTVAHHAEDIADVFSYADRVDSARIPFEILRALSWVASTLLGEECHAVVRLDPDYNYSILSCRREFEERGWGLEWSRAIAKVREHERTIKKSSAEQSQSRPYTLLLLGFPSYNANSILLHALAAHEFGHEIFYRYEERIWEILDKAVEVVTHKDHRFHIELQEYARINIKISGGGGLKDDYAKSVDHIRAKLLEFLNTWMMEVFSDLFAASLIGPTFIAAFDQIELKLHKVDKTHPPGHLRRELVKKYLEQNLPHVIQDAVWDDLFRGGEVKTKPSYSEIEEDDDPLASLYPIGEEICRLSLDGLSSLLKDRPSPLADENKLSELLEKTRDHIDHLAPPSVPLDITGTEEDASAFWLLMYAAWHYRLNTDYFNSFAERYGWAEAEDLSRAEDTLGNLVLHALESLELRFLWAARENKERLGDANGS